MRRFALCLFVLMIIFPMVLAGCDGGEEVEVTGAIEVGEEVEVATATISSSGGTISVGKPGDPVDGLEIEVPANSYPEARTFRVFYTPITGHAFGEDFNPISPLITIDNGGDYSDELMTVKIPVVIPGNHFAMGFFYDKETGELEGMPLLAVDSQSVTVATRHFSTIAVASININYLLNQEIDTGFKPGVDDWQFTNRGSYIAPGGHCTGQTLTAMWYYYEKRLDGDKPLYGLYDNDQALYNDRDKTPDFWEDDSLGYRLASIVQVDINWKKLAVGLAEKLSTLRISATGKLNSTGDDLTWYAFAYSMLLTGEPQQVLIYDTVAGGGHAILVYKISEDGALHIADPNYPANTTRQIDFVNGEFKPYDSVARAGTTGKKYDLITYFAKTALIPWSQITKRWQELEKKTVGDDKFPDYAVYWINDDGEIQEIKGDFNTGQGKVNLWAESQSLFAKNETVAYKVYRDNIEFKRDSDEKYELKAGNNVMGISVFGIVNGNYEYIGFKQFDVIYDSPAKLLIAEGRIPADQFDDEAEVMTNQLKLTIDTSTGLVAGTLDVTFYIPMDLEGEGEFVRVIASVDVTLEGTYTKGEVWEPAILTGTYRLVGVVGAEGQQVTEINTGDWMAEMDSNGNIEGIGDWLGEPLSFVATVK